ncbi:MAG: hypothetical protein KatS3mg132_442 [Limisphaera sp.]|nr:MAG: hypothetical protein KatS3mg132_442 [Limisphaera sp.]
MANGTCRRETGAVGGVPGLAVQRVARAATRWSVNDRWGKETRHKHGGYYTTEYAAGLPSDGFPSLGGEAAAWPTPTAGTASRTADDYTIRPRVDPGAVRHWSAAAATCPAGRRPHRRRPHPGDHAAAAPGDRRLAAGQRRGHLRHPVCRPRLPSGPRAGSPSKSSASLQRRSTTCSSRSANGPGRTDRRSSRCFSRASRDALVRHLRGLARSAAGLAGRRGPGRRAGDAAGRARSARRPPARARTSIIETPALGPGGGALPVRLRVQDRRSPVAAGGTAGRKPLSDPAAASPAGSGGRKAGRQRFRHAGFGVRLVSSGNRQEGTV